MQVNFFDLKEQTESVKDEFFVQVKEIIASNQFILGPKVEELEREVAKWCGVKHAVALASGTDALLVALMALDIKAGDEVITTPFTFFATAGSIARTGATPVFADISADTFNINPNEVRKKITKKTKCIMPVHLYGQCADMDEINKIAKDSGLFVIEDAAQSFGARLNGAQSGSLSDIGCFSFFPTKNLGAFGDAGMAICKNDALCAKMVALRNHGSQRRYYHDYIGGNFRMDAFQGAALLVKLKKVADYIKRRRENAAIYQSELKGVKSVALPIEVNGCLHTFNQFVIRTNRRDELKDFLEKNGIGTQVYYPLSLHQQDCLKYLGYKEGDFPVSEKVSNECLALPIYPELKENEIKYVCAKIRDFG